MKRISLLSIAVAVALAAGTAKAEPSVAQYEQYTGPRGTADTRLVFTMWLSGVSLGLVWMNTEAERHGAQSAFCAPDKFGDTADEYDALLRNYLQKRRVGLDPQKDAPKLADIDQFPAAFMMLDAFKDAFPCKKK